MSKISICLLLLAVLVSSSFIYSWKLNQSFKGTFTYYDNVGLGACGKQIDPSKQMLVAISSSQWTTANPNADPLCNNICVKVDYKGKSITVPVKDKCPGCNSTHIDLSKPAFAKLADLGKGHLGGATIKYIKCPK
uniref:RlpA-like protein double-psi beta-barrel domain-containing protein n=2 Tax=Meloidogyne javanica TaxID=6303 RepID=A0A915N5K4_MELJA